MPTGNPANLAPTLARLCCSCVHKLRSAANAGFTVANTFITCLQLLTFTLWYPCSNDSLKTVYIDQQ